MADKMASTSSNLPTYIDLLLSPDLPLDYVVLVGPSMVKFRVDKWMLVARSPQFRRMILDSPLKQDKQLELPDLDPVAFKNFLIYCYGHDHTSTLPFTELMDMLAIAELYNVPDLKTKLSTTIKPQLNADNVFVALNNALICDKFEELWKSVTEIVQFETEDVLSNPALQKASEESMLYIVQQDYLNVAEIDVWKAALVWARCQAQSAKRTSTVQNLRKIMLPLMKHIRFCTISKVQLVDEVFSSGILNGDEMSHISLAVKEKKQCANLKTICNRIEERCTSAVIHVEFAPDLNYTLIDHYVTVTPHCDVKLCSVMFLAKERSQIQELAYTCEGIIIVVNTQTSCQSDIRKEIAFVKNVKYGGTFSVRVDNISLKTKNSYRISVILSKGHKLLTNPKIVYGQNQLNQASTSNLISIKMETFKAGYSGYNNEKYGVYFKSLKFRSEQGRLNTNNTNKRKYSAM